MNVCYNNGLRFIHNLPINYSARTMFVELIRKHKIQLIESINNNDNKLVQAISNNIGHDSTLWKHWTASLFAL